MSRKEVHRPGLLKAACAGRITTRQVAEALRMSLRQARRLRQRFEAAGAAGIVHRGRGRPSPRRLAIATRDEVIRLMTTIYEGFNARWVQLRGPRSYAGVRVELRELLDGRLIVLHHGRLLGQTPSPPDGGFALKPRRSPSAARRASRARHPTDVRTASHHRHDPHGPSRLAVASMGHQQHRDIRSLEQPDKADIFT